MKYLKIEKGQGFYCIENQSWIPIDEITSEHLMKLLNIAVDNEFLMDEYNQDDIKNSAHQIIYQNICGKFTDLIENKSRFKDECDSLYKSTFKKYKKI